MTSLFFYNGRMFFTRVGPEHALPARLRARERRRRPAAVHQLQRHRHQLLRRCAAPSSRTTCSTSPTRRAGCGARSGPAPHRWPAPPYRSPGRARTPRPGTRARMFVFQASVSRPTSRRSRRSRRDLHQPGLRLRLDGLQRPRRQRRLRALAVRRRRHLDRRRRPAHTYAHGRSADRHSDGDRQRRGVELAPRRRSTRSCRPATRLLTRPPTSRAPCCTATSRRPGPVTPTAPSPATRGTSVTATPRPTRTRRTTSRRPGAQHVTLTVTDNDNDTGTATQGLHRLRHGQSRCRSSG